MESSEATLALARRVLALSREKDAAVVAGEYELAAGLREERERLMGELKLLGNAILTTNVERELRLGGTGVDVIKTLFPGAGEVEDARVTGALAGAGLPARWVVRGVEGSIVGAVRERVGAGSLLSAYFQAMVPWVGYRTLEKALRPGEYVDVLERFGARRGTPVVWVCGDVEWLEQVGVWGRMVEWFGREGSEFVVCVGGAGEGMVEKVLGLGGVREVVVEG